ncbi:MAG: YdcF family protein [Pseudomonadota bacterium]
MKIQFLSRVALIFIALSTLLLCTGFFIFIRFITPEKPKSVKNAQAIVALTGGPQRIEEAVFLLSQGKAERLLISGVNAETSRQDLKRQLPKYEKFFLCCIDLGHIARNTIGNALETRNWVKTKGFSSLIVVTASYHMPRSIIELRRAMPNVELIPYPVNPNKLHIDEIWSYPGTLWLVFKEYIKTLPALARLCISKL